MAAQRIGILTSEMEAQETCNKCKQGENENQEIICLGTLRCHKRALPRNGLDVCCHATPAADEHLAVVEVSSEDPPRSSPLTRVGL